MNTANHHLAQKDKKLIDSSTTACQSAPRNIYVPGKKNCTKAKVSSVLTSQGVTKAMNTTEFKHDNHGVKNNDIMQKKYCVGFGEVDLDYFHARESEQRECQNGID